jgi:hypothetical protein
MWGARFEKGVWYNLRLEYSVSTNKVTVYVNGNSVAEISGIRDKNSVSDPFVFNGFGVYIRNKMAEPLQLAFDNVYIGVK